jgi:Effector Associated Constant Component 1
LSYWDDIWQDMESVWDREARVSSERSSGIEEISLAVSDQSQLASLRQWLRETSQVTVRITPGQPGPGEQGALDVLTILASAPTLIAAIKVLPEFVRSRRSGFRIETTVRGKKFVLDATNSPEDLIAVIERLLDE